MSDGRVLGIIPPRGRCVCWVASEGVDRERLPRAPRMLDGATTKASDDAG